MATYTVSTSFRLATLKGISDALALFGARWNPQRVKISGEGDMPPTNRRYAWTTNRDAVLLTDVDTHDEDQAIRARSLLNETPPYPRPDIRRPDLGLQKLLDERFKLHLYVGEVIIDEDQDLGWLTESSQDTQLIKEGLWQANELRKDPYRTALKLASRLNLEMGDVDALLVRNTMRMNLSPNSYLREPDRLAQMAVAYLLSR